MIAQSAAISPNFGIEIPKQQHLNEVFVFFAADQIPGYIKANNSMWRPGGLLRPNALTLQYRLGYVRKCEITAMRTHMMSEQATNVHPNQRPLMTPVFDINDNGASRTVGKRKDGSHDGLLRMPFYPSTEAERLTGQGDGLVRMPVTNFSEALEAQLFLFPNWAAIMNGRGDELPVKIADIRQYFMTRRDDARSEMQMAVVEAAIQSCDDYRTWGQAETTRANATLREMTAKGNAWSYGLDAELAFSQLGLQREDRLVQDQGSQLSTLTDAVTKLVQHQAGLIAPTATAPAPQEDLQKKFEAFLAWQAQQEAEAATQAPAVDLPPAVSTPTDPGTPQEPEATPETAPSEPPTDLPPEEAPVYPAKIRQGDKVTVDGREAEVLSNAFGKYKVKFDDGFETTVTRGEIVAVEA